MSWLALVLLTFAIACLMGSFCAFKRKEWWRGIKYSLSSLLVMIIGFGLLAMISSLYTYAVLSKEQTIAEVHIHQLAKQRFALTLSLPTGSASTYDLKGDQWVLSAKVLVWNRFGQFLGLESRYQLERLGTSYNDLAEEQEAPHTVYALNNSNPPAWMFWTRVNSLALLVRTVYGSAVYMPLIEGADYEVKLTQTGLMAIPKNDAAIYPTFSPYQ